MPFPWLTKALCMQHYNLSMNFRFADGGLHSNGITDIWMTIDDILLLLITTDPHGDRHLRRISCSVEFILF